MSPKSAARLAGILYLVVIAGGLFAELGVRGQVMVPGDAAATVANILDHERLFRTGFAVHLFYLACALPIALILYRLFSPVNRHLALLALLFNLVAITVEAGNLLNQFAPLRVLAAADAGLVAEQVDGLVYLYLRLFSAGFGISLTFFGFFCLLIGYLVFVSGLLPRAIGVLMALAGACYLVNSFTVFLAPAVANVLFPYILLPCLVGELVFALWLVARGVNLDRWDGTSARGNPAAGKAELPYE